MMGVMGITMQSKDFLKRANYLDLSIKTKREELEKLRSLALNVTGALQENKVTVPLRKDRMEDTVIKMVLMEDAINKDIDKYMGIIRDVSEKIRLLKNDGERILLEMRYLCGKSWDEIADEMNISLSHTYNIHGRALKNLNIILNDEQAAV